MKFIVGIGLVLASSVVAAPSQATVLTSDGFSYTDTNNEVTITGCATTCPASLVIPTHLTATGSDAVVAIGGYAFANAAITSTTISTTVRTIGTGAFQDADGLVSVNFATPSSLTTIGGMAFAGLSATSIALPASVTSVGDGAFGWNEFLTTFTFGAGSTLTTLPIYFLTDSHLTSIEIPATVTSIGERSFGGASTLTSVKFFGNAPTAHANAFQDSPNVVVSRPASATGWEATLASRNVVTGVAPASVSGFGITGKAVKGKVLTAGLGVWNITSGRTVAYQWYSCTTKVAASAAAVKCAKLSGATKNKYTPGKASVGKYIRVRVTYTTAYGSTVKFSITSKAVAKK